MKVLRANNVNTKELNAKLLELTVANTVKRQSVANVNDLLVEVLLKPKARMTRVELINAISIKRFEAKYGPGLLEVITSEPELTENFVKIVKTVKNGVDTGLSRSNNNSSFFYNQKYAKYILVENSDKTYEMVLNTDIK
jgi:hypothetical protein